MDKLLYGLPQLAISASEVFLRLYLLIFLTEQVELSGKTGAFLMAISLILSTLTDPLIGKFSDWWKTKYGQLKGLTLFSTINFGVSIGLIFIPNWNADETFFIFLALVYYQASYSFFTVPYLSLAKFLIKKESDIIALYSWRYLWGSIGALIGVSLPALRGTMGENTFLPMAICMVSLLILIGPPILSLLKEPKKTYSKIIVNINLKKDLQHLFKNRPYLMYFCCFTFLSIGLGVNQTLAVYYYKNGLLLNENQVNLLLFFYMIVFSLSIPFWVHKAKTIGKKKLLNIGLSFVALCTFIYPFINPGQLFFLYTIIFIAGFFTGVVVLVDSFLSNIIDYHNFKTKNQYSSFLFSIWRINDKLSRAFGIYLAGVLLDISLKGTSPFITIKTSFGFGVFIFLALSTALLFVIKYREKHHDIVIKYLKKKNPDLIATEN